MGTTQTAVRAGNVTLAYVLCIEGYEYLLTDGIPGDAVTAWASTSWSKALPGLAVAGSFQQSLHPWSNEIKIPRFKFSIQPDETDQFAIDMFKIKPSVRSELTIGFDTADSAGGGFNINVKDAGDFSTGLVFIGNEAYNVTTGPSGTTIPVAVNGAGFMHPFSSDIGPVNTFVGPHSLPAGISIGANENVSPVYVTDSPPTWLGKKVGLYVHRVVNGVLDTYSEAELWFAGTIANVSESGMNTIVECDGIQQAIVDATLMQDQWTGRIAPGYEFIDGDFIKVQFDLNPGSNFHSAALVAATPGTGSNEFPSGVYLVEEIASIISKHADADGTIGVTGSSISLRWSSKISSTGAGMRFSLTAEENGSTTGRLLIYSKARFLRFLGFNKLTPHSDDNDTAWVVGVNQTDTRITMTADGPPRHVAPFEWARSMVITIDESDGIFIDHTSSLPASAREYVDASASEVWSYYMIDGKTLILGRRDSATKISGITAFTDMSRISNEKIYEDDKPSITGIIKQVYFTTGQFKDVISELFASVDGNGENHATYDVLPFGAGIPWGLLGDNFLDSLSSLEQSGAENTISLLIEKPTRLWDAIKSEFTLRMAAPIWKDGGIQFAQLSVPNASTADFTLDESNKSDKERTITEQTSEFLAHTLKVEYNRNPITDKYLDNFVSRDITAYQSAGGAGATKTIKARNSYGGSVHTGTSVEALADMITARFLPVFAKPLRRWKRSIPHTMFHIAPGDTVAFSDDFVRDPLTGTRGVSARPAIVLAVSYSLGISSSQGYHGEVELLFTEEDRLFPLAPSAEHADATTVTGGGARNWTNGYDDEVGTVGIFSLLVHQHSFSNLLGEPNDSESFLSGHEVRITEIDPSDPATADTFTDTIASVAQDVTTISTVVYDEIVLTTGFGNSGNPAFDNTKSYTVNFDSYSTVGDDQKLVSFQADDSDGKILNLIDPNLVADRTLNYRAVAKSLALPSRHSSEQYGDGVPLSASFIRDRIRMANNLIDYKTALHSPSAGSTANAWIQTTSDDDYRILAIFPILIGDMGWHGSVKRVLHVSPMLRVRSGAGGTTANIRISSSAHPPGNESLTDQKAVWNGARSYAVFSTTSLSFIIPSMQEIDIVRAWLIPEMTWITIETGDSAESKEGLPELWIGPRI